MQSFQCSYRNWGVDVRFNCAITWVSNCLSCWYIREWKWFTESNHSSIVQVHLVDYFQERERIFRRVSQVCFMRRFQDIHKPSCEYVLGRIAYIWGILSAPYVGNLIHNPEGGGRIWRQLNRISIMMNPHMASTNSSGPTALTQQSEWLMTVHYHKSHLICFTGIHLSCKQWSMPFDQSLTQLLDKLPIIVLTLREESRKWSTESVLQPVACVNN